MTSSMNCPTNGPSPKSQGIVPVKDHEPLASVERLGLATSYYPKSVLAARRREARSLGFGSNDSATADLDVELENLLLPYREAFGEAGPAREASAAQAKRPPAQVAPDIAAGLPGT